MGWHGFTCKKNHKDGFNIKLYDSHISVRPRANGIVRIDGSIVTDINPYAYYHLFETISDRLLNCWMPSQESLFSKAPRNIQLEWYKKKVMKYWGRTIHCEWKNMLKRMDPARLNLARAMFAANFGKSRAFVGTALLTYYDKAHPSVIEEIINFPAAAMLANRYPEFFIENPKIKIEFNRQSITVPSSTTKHQDLDEHENDLLSTEKEEEATTLSDWRAFYTDELTINKALCETLEAVKPGISFHDLVALRTFVLERPLLSKQEIIISGHAKRTQDVDSFRVSDKQNIIDSIKTLRNANKGEKLNCRKSEHLISSMEKVDSQPKGTQDMLALTKRKLSTKIFYPISSGSKRKFKKIVAFQP